MTEPSDARPGDAPAPPPEGHGPPAAGRDQDHDEEPARIVIRNKRKVGAAGEEKRGKHHAAEPDPAADGDAAAGSAAAPSEEAVLEPEPAGSASGHPTGPNDEGGLGAELAALRTALEERTRDAQRVAAEFANYRRRVEREKTTAAEEATANVFRALLPVLDDLDRAREHEELADGVAAVADQLVATVGKFGLSAFGEKGDRFDPTRHEAVAHLTSADVTEPTCIDVLRRGYLLGNSLLRPAMVAVASPAEGDTADPD